MERDNLVEIKKGKTGTGYLIENDGYVSMENYKAINEAYNGKDNDGKYCPYPFVVSAVFQKYGIKNANGRIYPENVLKREVQRYMKKIQDKNAIGECYTPDVLCLCEDGWKPLRDVKEGDMVLSLNVETKEIELKKVIRKIEKIHNGEMIRLKGNTINDLVTPKHQFPVFDKDINFVNIYSAEEIYNKEIENIDDLYLIKNGEYEEFEIIPLSHDSLDVTKEEYNGEVMCVEVEDNHNWYVMSNGFSHWTNNCNHPAESVIDLSRTSINILELHWEGHTLLGKMEILVTPGFVNSGIVSTCADEIANLLMHGIKIGVSSRAFGTVEQIGDTLYVKDDLELICWDVVSNPSTPNAWISTNGEEGLQQYVENTEKNTQNKEIISEKIDKISNILNIL